MSPLSYACRNIKKNPLRLLVGTLRSESDGALYVRSRTAADRHCRQRCLVACGCALRQRRGARGVPRARARTIAGNGRATPRSTAAAAQSAHVYPALLRQTATSVASGGATTTTPVHHAGPARPQADDHSTSSASACTTHAPSQTSHTPHSHSSQNSVVS